MKLAIVISILLSCSVIAEAGLQESTIRDEEQPVGSTHRRLALSATQTSGGSSGARKLARAILGAGTSLESAKFIVNNPIQYGTFADGRDAFGLDEGIILSTTNVKSIEGGTDGDYPGGSSSGASYAPLSILADEQSTDAAVLEIKFKCAYPGGFSFKYVFGSDEYPKSSQSKNDIAAAFLNGYTAKQNTMKVNGSPISVDSINCQTPSNCEYYVSNPSQAVTQGDAFTAPLYAKGVTIPGVNTLTIAIADIGGPFKPSWLMIEKKSLTCLPPPVWAVASKSTSNSEALALANILADTNDVNIVSATFEKGLAQQFGRFYQAGPSVGLTGGIILSSGYVNQVDYVQGGAQQGNFGQAGDSGLSNVIGGETTHDAAILKIDFTCKNSKSDFSFKYVFGSDEYPTPENDVAAAFLNGINVLLFPDSSDTVNVDNLGPSTNSRYFINNAENAPVQLRTEMDGFTPPLYAEGSPNGGTNTLRIGIADAGADAGIPSWLLLEAKSLACKAPPPEICPGGYVYGFRLYSANTSTNNYSFLRTIWQGDTFCPPLNWSIEAVVVKCKSIAKVKFELKPKKKKNREANTQSGSDSDGPYFMFGNAGNPGQIFPSSRRLRNGTYTLKAIPYKNGKTPGKALSIKIKVKC